MVISSILGDILIYGKWLLSINTALKDCTHFSEPLGPEVDILEDQDPEIVFPETKSNYQTSFYEVKVVVLCWALRLGGAECLIS